MSRSVILARSNLEALTTCLGRKSRYRWERTRSRTCHPQLVGRLLLIGYIKVNDKRRFRPDHHFYATADEIVSVEDDTVRLGKLRDELIKSSQLADQQPGARTTDGATDHS